MGNVQQKEEGHRCGEMLMVLARLRLGRNCEVELARPAREECSATWILSND